MIINNQVQQNFGSFAKYQTVVDEHLVRGRCVTNPFRLYSMKQEGINQIIDLRNTCYIKRPLEKFFCKLLDINYENFRYSYRNPELPSEDFFSRLNQKIIDNDGKTYIHCAHGKRRTGICVAIYEKFNTPKSDKDIIDNMIDLGFHEVEDPTNTRKNKRIKTIYNNLIGQYFPELKKVD